MSALSRFFSELSMLFREMYGLEVVVAVVFFLLGLWLMRLLASEGEKAVQVGLEKQDRLKGAAAALRVGSGIEQPIRGTEAPTGTVAERSSGRSSPRMARETEPVRNVPDQRAGESVEAITLPVTVGGADVVPPFAIGGPGVSIPPILEAPEGRDGEGEGHMEAAGASVEDRGEPCSDKEEAPVPPEKVVPMPGAFSDEKGMRNDPTLGSVYEKRPKTVDDLKLIHGIGAKVEGQLNRAGIYRISQIAHWSATHAEAFGARLKTGAKIGREGWIDQAKRLLEADRQPEENALKKEEQGEKPAGDADKKVGKGAPKGISEPEGQSPGKESRAQVPPAFSQEPVEVDPLLGVYYPHRPGVIDDLSEIGGIGPTTVTKLHELGVYRFAQIAHWSDSTVTEIDKRLHSKGKVEREKWVAQAKKLASRAAKDWEKLGDLIRRQFSGECVTMKPEWGIVYLEDPGEGDDLSALKTLDASRVKALNTLGIYRFKQMASWKDANARAIDKALGLKSGSASRWRAEARKLAGKGEEDGEKSASGG